MHFFVVFSFLGAAAYIDDIPSQAFPFLQEETTIPANQGYVDITLDFTDDTIPESAETIIFYIVNAGDDYICPDRRRVIITKSDDDSELTNATLLFVMTHPLYWILLFFFLQIVI